MSSVILPIPPSDERRELKHGVLLREYKRFITPDRKRIWVAYQSIDNVVGESEQIRLLEKMMITERIGLIRHIAESLGWICTGSLEACQIHIVAPLEWQLPEGDES